MEREQIAVHHRHDLMYDAVGITVLVLGLALVVVLWLYLGLASTAA
jgi:hypothetical protein